MILISLILFAILGGWVSRMCGGAPPKLPIGMAQWVYAYPYAVIASFSFIEESFFYWPAYTLALLSALAGKRTGHGGGMDLGNSPKEPGQGRTPEKLEYLILWLHGRIDRYWYDVLLLAITGLAVTIIPGLILVMSNPIWGAFLAISGITKAPAYMIGRWVYPACRVSPYFNEATAIGEFLTGFLAYVAIGLCYFGVMYAH